VELRGKRKQLPAHPVTIRERNSWDEPPKKEKLICRVRRGPIRREPIKKEPISKKASLESSKNWEKKKHSLIAESRKGHTGRKTL